MCAASVRAALLLIPSHACHPSPCKDVCVPSQLKLLSSDQDQTQLQSWRMQDLLLAMLILLSAVAALHGALLSWAPRYLSFLLTFVDTGNVRELHQSIAATYRVPYAQASASTSKAMLFPTLAVHLRIWLHGL